MKETELVVLVPILLLLRLQVISCQQSDYCSYENSCIMSARKLVKVEFEVFGRVQGVFFRKTTVKQGKQLGLRGWCMNTTRDTVVGEIEGEPDRVNEMKYWLANVGSKSSRIDKAEFRNEKEISNYSFNDFSVR